MLKATPTTLHRLRYTRRSRHKAAALVALLGIFPQNTTSRFSQATLQQEDAETMVCTGEMLWTLGEAKVVTFV